MDNFCSIIFIRNYGKTQIENNLQLVNRTKVSYLYTFNSTIVKFVWTVNQTLSSLWSWPRFSGVLLVVLLTVNFWSLIIIKNVELYCSGYKRCQLQITSHIFCLRAMIGRVALLSESEDDERLTLKQIYRKRRGIISERLVNWFHHCLFVYIPGGLSSESMSS